MPSAERCSAEHLQAAPFIALLADLFDALAELGIVRRGIDQPSVARPAVAGVLQDGARLVEIEFRLWWQVGIVPRAALGEEGVRLRDAPGAFPDDLDEEVAVERVVPGAAKLDVAPRQVRDARHAVQPIDVRRADDLDVRRLLQL